VRLAFRDRSAYTLSKTSLRFARETASLARMRKRHLALRDLVSIALVGVPMIADATPVLAAPATTLSAITSNVPSPAASTNAVADLYVRYIEPRTNAPTTASLTLHVDAGVNREELLVALDDRAIATDQLGAPLRVLAGAHRVRVEQLCANGVRSQSEFAFTVGPGDSYEHTIAVNAVLAPSVLRARGCCASVPNASTPQLLLPSLLAVMVACAARRRATTRAHAGERPRA
jgi:hypothetical protein